MPRAAPNPLETPWERGYSVHKPVNIDDLDIIQVARQLYLGRPMAYQGRDDFRIGNSGSISIRPSTAEWYDHEAERGGGVREMVEHARRTCDGVA